MGKAADLHLQAHGTIYLLRAISERGEKWLDHHICRAHEEWAGAIVVEARFIADIVCGALHDGLEMR
jgi:hypothetical protein